MSSFRFLENKLIFAKDNSIEFVDLNCIEKIEFSEGYNSVRLTLTNSYVEFKVHDKNEWRFLKLEIMENPKLFSQLEDTVA